MTTRPWGLASGNVPFDFSGPAAGCVPNIEASPGLDDEECWNRIDFGEENDATSVSADGYTWIKTFTRSIGDLGFHAVEFSTYYDTESDPHFPGPPCQPRPCDSGIRLSFDYALSLAVSTLSGSPTFESALRMFAEILEFADGGGAGNGNGDDFDGEISAAVGGTTGTSGTITLEISPSVMVDAAIIAASIGNSLQFSGDAGSGSAEIDVSVTVSNLLWEAI